MACINFREIRFQNKQFPGLQTKQFFNGPSMSKSSGISTERFFVALKIAYTSQKRPHQMVGFDGALYFKIPKAVVTLRVLQVEKQYFTQVSLS